MDKALKVYLFVLLVCVFSVNLFAQYQPGDPAIFEPDLGVVRYDPENEPEKPLSGQLVMWVATKRVNWDTDAFIPYYYNQMPFRLMYPKNYDPNSGEKYPIIIMLHGRGEKGSIYDNEYSMKHGGSKHRDAVNNGVFNGFVLFPQNEGGFWGDSHYSILNDLITNHLVDKIHLDLDKIIIHGLSAGGQGTWNFIGKYPKLFAAALPMSSASPNFNSFIPNLKHIPIWLSSGGKDTNPTPFTATSLVNEIKQVGGNIIHSLYENLGHGVWNTHYNETDFFPYINRAHKTNPLVFFGKSEFCPGEPIDARLGFTNGFEDYEWRKDGQIIFGETANEIVVNEVGIYDGRFKRNGEWSQWSEVPVEIKIKETTYTPPIQVSGLQSKVVPSPDGSQGVVLELPEGYESYQWRKVGTTEILGTSRFFTATEPGSYEANVTELYGCSSVFSNPFKVISSDGVNGPEAGTGLIGYALSKTSIELSWNDDPNPAFNETGYEIYRKELGETAFALLSISEANATSFIDEGLEANTSYIYIVRAVNENGAALNSNEATVITQLDNIIPTAPLNLKVVSTTSNGVGLKWEPSIDDVGIKKYEIYQDGQKVLVTKETNISVFGLTQYEVYSFSVKGVDLSDNVSEYSNQVTAAAINSGLAYSYYEGSFSNLSQLDAAIPVKNGISETFDLSPRQRNSSIAFKWEGNIQIPNDGEYTFYTESDDGSTLFINGVQIVFNDYNQGMKERSGKITLSSGNYPIEVRWRQGGGGYGLNVRWAGPGIGKEIIPTSVFKEEFTMPGVAPSSPTNLNAVALSYDKINLTWDDNSNNETGFQLFRSVGPSGPYYPIAVIDSNAVEYLDTNLEGNTNYYYQLVALGKYGESGTISPPIANIAPINSGIAAQDNATGDGYIMYSEEYVRDRFTSPRPHSSNSYYFIAVKYMNEAWYYDNNSVYTQFTPLESDLLMGSIDFSNDQIISDFEGTSGEINGIESGFFSGDLTFYADHWNGGSNDGEFTIDGTYFIKNTANLAEATTAPLPPAPLAPSSLLASSTSDSQIKLDWIDNSMDELEFNVYRSFGDNGNFKLIATLPENSISFLDTGLFVNTIYYYKVEALNVGGDNSSNESFAKTQNNLPVLDPSGNQSMRFGTGLDIQIYSEDIDGEELALSVNNLPAFGNFVDYGDGTGLLSFNPAESDQGIFNNIVILVEDQNNGVDSDTINLIVDENYLPVLSDFDNYSIAEGEYLEVPVISTDNNENDILSLEISPVSSFVELESTANGEGILKISPGYQDGGEYVFSIIVKDNNGGETSKSLSISVAEEKTDYRFSINFHDNSSTASETPWNNVSTLNAGTGINNLIDHDGDISEVSFVLMETWSGKNNLGETGGIYPDNVTKSYFFEKIDDTRNIQFSGLNPEFVYDFTFFASRMGSGSRTTDYIIGTKKISLNPDGNTSNTVSINSVRSDSLGNLNVIVSRPNGSTHAYINALVINGIYDDGEVSEAPSDLSSTLLSSNEIILQWKDNSVNERVFEIHRGQSSEGPFTLLATVQNDVEEYVDNSVIGSSTYYYFVKSVNNNGESSSTVHSVITTNSAPEMQDISPLVVLEKEVFELDIEASDLEGDLITFSINGHPSFVSINDLGNGSAQLVIAPILGDMNNYSFNLIATDSKGESSSQSITLEVIDKVVTSVLVNFSMNITAASPWNNMESSPNAGTSLNNLVDENGSNSGISLTLVDAWDGGNDNNGVSSGDNTGIYPDNVTRSYYADDSDTEIKNIKIDGLDINKVYDLVFFASRKDITADRITKYQVGETSALLNVKQNVDNTAKINGISPDSNGEILIEVSKESGAFFYLGALIIRSYVPNETPSTPLELTGRGISKSAVELEWIDNSSNEDSFKIYRAESIDGQYEFVASVASNTQSFTDSLLQEAKSYFYKVKAQNTAGESAFSNFAEVATYKFSVFINFSNPSNPAPAPWNNTGNDPFVGNLYPNLKNSDNNNTGIRMEIIENANETSFAAFGSGGSVTGDDSGVYPDAVISTYWWMEQFEPATLKFDNFNLDYEYNFVFFASRAKDNRGTDFTIGSESVSLNAAYNIDKTVTIEGVYPNEFGEIIMDMVSRAGATHAHFGALEIHALPKKTSANQRIVSKIFEPNSTDKLIDLNELNVYPNPFSNQITIYTEVGVVDGLSLELFDLAGKKIYSNKVGEELSNEIKIDLGQGSYSSGMYLMKIGSEELGYIVKKLIKN